MKILLDTNVILDAVTQRYNDYNYSKFILQCAATNKIKGYISSSQITDLYYCLRKYVSDEEKKRNFIITLLSFLELVHPLKTNLISASKSIIDDYEDAVLDDIARINCIDYICTNNLKDFKDSKIAIINPKELTTLLKLN